MSSTWCRAVLLGTLAVPLAFGAAQGGRNAGGALVVHVNDAIDYRAGGDYCSTPVPSTCEELVTRSDKYDPLPTVLWFLWAFHPDADPEVTGLRLGVRTSLPPEYFETWYVCGAGALEVPTSAPDYPDWPLNGSGDAITWPRPSYGHVQPFYSFVLYGSAPGDYFGTTVDPRVGFASFSDNSNPPVEDHCTRFGAVAWGESGFNECPEPPIHPGACCFEDGRCQLMVRDECTAAGGEFQGEDTVCQPNPCPQVEACCFEDGHCEDLLSGICMERGGVPEGAGTDCATFECPQPPQACCFEDGHCEDLPPETCIERGGTPRGVGTVCATTECPEAPTGACCFGEDCRVTTQRYCEEHGGRYLGDDMLCEPNPCDGSPTRQTTWGQVKASYR